MRSKVPVGTASSRPHFQVNNYEQINSPGDDIRVAMAKDTRKAGCSTAASGASCDKEDGEEEYGNDAEEDWPENGHDVSASGDEIPAGDTDDDEWWNWPVGKDDEVEEWRAGDSDNNVAADADGEHAEAVAYATVQARAAATATAEYVPAGATVDADANAVADADDRSGSGSGCGCGCGCCRGCGGKCGCGCGGGCGCWCWEGRC
ncbi:unnamed protein product [Closterium sp. NIES-54]